MIPGIDVRSGLLQDASGVLWLLPYGRGLRRQDASGTQALTTRDGLADNLTSCLCLDGRGTLWIGTEGRGVSRFDGTNFHTYTRAEGLAGGTACPPFLVANADGAVAGRLPGWTAVVMNSSVPRDWVGPEFLNAVGIPDRACGNCRLGDSGHHDFAQACQAMAIAFSDWMKVIRHSVRLRCSLRFTAALHDEYKHSGIRHHVA